MILTLQDQLFPLHLYTFFVHWSKEKIFKKSIELNYMVENYLKYVANNNGVHSTAKMCCSQNVSYIRYVVGFWLIIHSPFCFARSVIYNRPIWTYWTHAFSFFSFKIISRLVIVQDRADWSIDVWDWTASKRLGWGQTHSRWQDLKILPSWVSRINSTNSN
jgi:hypothetical protein